MIFNTVVIKNTDSIDHSIMGTIVSPGNEYIVSDNMRMAISNNDSILEKIANGLLQVGDGSQFFVTANDQFRWLLNNTQILNVSPFASKTIGNKRLFTRVHGIQQAVINGTNTIEFVVPYLEAKFNALEIINADENDTVSLEILDSDSGIVSGYPNYKLNQFGFNLNLPAGFYVRQSEYDADLVYGLIIKLIYNTPIEKTVGINIILHELKS